MATLDTEATRPSGDSHATGKAYFETSTNKFIVWNGSSWVELDSDGTGSAPFQNRWGASFDGDAQYLKINGLASLLNDLQKVSYSCWYKGTDTSGYIFRASPSNAADPHIGMSIYNDTLYTTISNGSTTVYGTHGVTINDGDWHHLAVTFDGSINVAKSYIDGNTGANLSGAAPSTIGTGYNAANIGRRPTFTHLYTAGLIDDVAIFDAALSAPDVTKIYSNGNPTDLKLAASYDTDRTSDLIGYWRMGDDSSDTATSGGSIATITDSSGNGNHATQTDTTNQPTFADLTAETIYV